MPDDKPARPPLTPAEQVRAVMEAAPAQDVATGTQELHIPFTGYFKLLWQMLGDPAYVLPWKLKLLAVVCILYVLSPVDLIPFMLLPIIGLADDSMVVVFTVMQFRAEIRRYAARLAGMKIPPTE